jgi:hypothetical protein
MISCNITTNRTLFINYVRIADYILVFVAPEKIHRQRLFNNELAESYAMLSEFLAFSQRHGETSGVDGEGAANVFNTTCE